MELSVNKFKANLKSYVDKAIEEHKVLRVNRRSGKDFVVMSAEGWEREQETLYVIRNQSHERECSKWCRESILNILNFLNPLTH